MGEESMSRSIEAYDLPQRVASYDADMELMHPNRSPMIRVALEVLPFERTASLRALDLGVGTGYFTRCFLERFPSGRVLAVDGASAMVDLARTRLGPLASQVEFRVGDFRSLAELARDTGAIDVVFSSYALHHLGSEDKLAVLRHAVGLLRPRGWLVNADLIVADSPAMEERLQEMRVEGIVTRAAGKDPRFADAVTTRGFLDALQANEDDRPLTLSEDLALLRDAGLRDSAVFWLENREMVSGGRK